MSKQGVKILIAVSGICFGVGVVSSNAILLQSALILFTFGLAYSL